MVAANRRILVIERIAGVPSQFESAGDGYLFRRHGCGPAIRISAADRTGFAAAGVWATWWHLVALVVCAGALWLAIDRGPMASGPAAVAFAFGLGISLIAMLLHQSLLWHADAPARALAGRAPELPAREPRLEGRWSYGAIVALTLFLLVASVTGTRQPKSIYIAFATASVLLGLYLAARKWRFDRSLTPPQRARAVQTAMRVTDEGRSVWSVVGLFLFLILEIIAIVLGLFGTAAAVLGASGATFETAPTPVLVAAFVCGMAVATAVGWIVDRVGRRLTGASAFALLCALPASW